MLAFYGIIENGSHLIFPKAIYGLFTLRNGLASTELLKDVAFDSPSNGHAQGERRIRQVLSHGNHPRFPDEMKQPIGPFQLTVIFPSKRNFSVVEGNHGVLGHGWLGSMP